MRPDVEALRDGGEAADHYEAARAIQEKTLGPEHPELRGAGVRGGESDYCSDFMD